MENAQLLSVFISYSHEDEDLKEKLEVHLASLDRDGVIKLWQDRKIEAGKDWDYEIREALETAQIIMLLITPDFLASHYCFDKETKRAMERHEEGTARVIPVIMKPSNWQYSPFSKLQVLPKDGEPCISWDNLDEAMLDVVNGLRRVVKSLGTTFQSQISQNTAKTEAYGLPPRNSLFTGREDILGELHRKLISEGIAVLNGLGGIGKTQIAIEYSHRVQNAESPCKENPYEWILWVKSDTDLALSRTLSAIAQHLNLTWKSEEEQIASVEEWLETHENWLLVFDNADDLQVIENFMSLALQGKVLITSRTANFEDFFGNFSFKVIDTIHLNSFTQEEAISFLIKRVKKLLRPTDEKGKVNAGKIAEQLGCLPLALEQAGAYVNKLEISFEAYLNKYNNLHLDLFQSKHSAPKSKGYQKTVLTAWTLNFNEIDKKEPVSIQLLQTCAFLAPDNIPFEFFEKASEYLEISLSSKPEDPHELLIPLRDYSLIQLHENNIYSIHRLVQEVVRRQVKESDIPYQCLERAILTVDSLFPEDTSFKNWDRCEQYSSHIAHLVKWFNTYLNTEKYLNTKEFRYIAEVMAPLLNKTGAYFFQRGSNDIAESMYNDALILTRQLKSLELLEASILNNKAILNEQLGLHSEAESLYRNSLAIRQNLLEENDPIVASVLLNLGNLYRQKGRFNEAEPLLQKTLEIYEELSKNQASKYSSILSRNLNYMGLIYQQKQEYSRAEDHFYRALKIRENLWQEGHPTLADSHDLLGSLYMVWEKYSESESQYLKSLAIRRRFFSDESIDVLSSQDKLTKLYFKQRLYSKAKINSRKTLLQKKKSLEEDHISLWESFHDLAAIYYAEKHYKRALLLCLSSIRILKQYEISLENEHISRTMENLKIYIREYASYSGNIKLYNEVRSHRNINWNDFLSLNITAEGNAYTNSNLIEILINSFRLKRF